MKILYLGYWGANEGLSQATINPNLEVLANFNFVEKIHYISIEREGTENFLIPKIDKLKHHPYFTTAGTGLFSKLKAKVADFTAVPGMIRQLAREHQIDCIIARSAMAGGLVIISKVYEKCLFIVESFEPHAEYMLDSKVWKKYGFRYQFQKYYERQVILKANHIVTVSRHFTDWLKEKYSREARTFACAVDTKRFEFSKEKRRETREFLGWPSDCITGIYVGKFGDIYYREEAYEIFKQAFDFFGSKFRLIILSPDSKTTIKGHLMEVGINPEYCFVDLVPHRLVTDYLSAADFAFSMVRPAPIRLYCSPIKDGEYWANGLPILSADKIGEDSDIIREELAGAIFNDDQSDLREAFEQIQKLMVEKNRLGPIREVALKYRSFHHLPGLYEVLLS